MKWLKIIIIVLIIAIIATIALIGYLNNKPNQDITNTINTNNIINNNYINDEERNEYKYENMIQVESSKPKLIEDKNKYYTIAEIVKSYSDNTFVINKMYILKKNNTIDIFWIEGFTKENGVISNFIVITDSQNNTFLIFNQDKIDKEKYKLENLEEINIYSIDKQEDNEFTYKEIGDESYSKLLLKNYISKLLYNTQIAYDCLDDEYRLRKFGSLERYNEYVNNNKDIFMLYDAKNIKQPGEFENFEEWNMYFSGIKLLELEKYLVKEREGYTEYTLIDTFGNYYIFHETSPMQYSVILDMYTVDIPEFLEKYEKGTEEEKVKMNIRRFFESLYQNDYEYAYTKLDDSFKLQYFSSIENLKEYTINTFIYDENIEYSNFITVEDGYKIDIKLENGEKIVEKTFTIELLEGTEYTVAFDI